MDFGRPLATVTPTLDGDVLAVLATNDVAFTTGQIHRILDRFSEEGIRKVLVRLAQQGVVLVERAGNAYTYRFNSSHLAAEAIASMARMPNTFLDRLEALYAAWLEPPRYAAVFGSAATGSMTVDSDIDLFLVRRDEVPDEIWEGQRGELSEQVSRWTGNDARAVEYSIAGLRAGRDEPVLRDVVEHGLTVAGTRSWLLQQVGPRRRSEA
jgi:hypothetical protein